MKNPHKLDRLLSGRNRLAVTEKEAMLAELLNRTGSARGWRWPIVGSLALTSFASFLFYISRPTDEFAARGGGAVNFRVSCQPNVIATACRPGDRIYFEVTPNAKLHYFAAFAETTDGVTWYFPATEGGKSLSPEHAGWLPEAVLIDPDEPSGTVTVRGVFSAAPLERNSLRDLFREETPGARADVVLLTRTFEIRR